MMGGDNIVNVEEPEKHIYNHYDPREPEIDLEVGHTTRGPSWKVFIKGAVSPEQAIKLYRETASGLGDLFNKEEEEEDEKPKSD